MKCATTLAYPLAAPCSIEKPASGPPSPNWAIGSDGGSTALMVGSLFGPGTAFRTVAASMAQTIFDAGTLLYRKRAAEAAFDQAAAQYTQTVLTASQNVADTLRAVQTDADGLVAEAAAERAAARGLEIAQRQLAVGAVNYLALLNTQNPRRRGDR